MTKLYKIDENLLVGSTGKKLKDIANLDNSLSNNGYVKLQNGLIIQWFRASKTFTGRQDFTQIFPQAFPNNCFTVLASISDSGYGGSVPHTAIEIVNFSKTQLNYTYKTSYSSSQSITAYFLAIGN